MLSVIMLSVITLSVVMLNVVMLNVVMLNVIMLSVLVLSVVMLNVIMVECRSAGNYHGICLTNNTKFNLTKMAIKNCGKDVNYPIILTLKKFC
jgi:hypothetical protein